MEKIMALIMTLISFIGALGIVCMLANETEGLEVSLMILGLWTSAVVIFIVSAKELLS